MKPSPLVSPGVREIPSRTTKFTPPSEFWVSLGSAVLSVLTTLSDKRDPQLMAVPEYGRGPLILDFA